MISLIHSPNHSAAQATLVSKLPLQPDRLLIIVANPLRLTVRHKLDTSLLIQRRSQPTLGNNIVDLPQIQRPFRIRARPRHPSSRELTNAVGSRAIRLRKRERAAIPRKTCVDLLRHHFAPPQEVQRAINFGEVGMREDVRACADGVFIPDAVHVVRHDVEKVDVLLHAGGIEILHVEVRSWEGD